MTDERRLAEDQAGGAMSRPSSGRPTHETPCGGISNQSANEERASQERVPPRGTSNEPSWTRQAEGAEGGELMARTARAMRDGNIGDVLVTQDGRLIGILTDRDVVIRVLADGRDPDKTALGDVCSRHLTTLSPNDAIETAVAKMRESAIRRLPVVEEGRPVGIVALGDLAVERDPQSALGEISAAPPTG